MKLTLTQVANRRKAFTLMEVIISIAIASILGGGIIMGYVQTTQRAEWSAYSLAAQSLAMQRLEQTRAAKWDPLAPTPVTNQLVAASFPVATEILDIPISGTNITFAIITTTITDVSITPRLKLIRVQCVWPFKNRGVFTNTVMTYRAPDQ